MLVPGNMVKQALIHPQMYVLHTSNLEGSSFGKIGGPIKSLRPTSFDYMPGPLIAKLVPVHTGERSLGSRWRLGRVLKAVVSPRHLALMQWKIPRSRWSIIYSNPLHEDFEMCFWDGTWMMCP